MEFVDTMRTLEDIYEKYEKRVSIQISNDDYNNLTYAETRTLYAIGYPEGKYMKQISEILGIASNTATVAVNRLEKKGLVKRELGLEDKRQFLISLTEDAKKLLDQVDKIFIDEMKRLFAPLSDTEILLLKNLLLKINSKY
ncbi:MarR family winged helix-turn-helix transcriptional regulator [Gottschalkia purinilytica]|nr:MarR family transcriptional regulator [Gottschalkia purinilytica]